jgi:hypothetical protein
MIETDRDIQIRRARLEDLPAILAFVDDCYGAAAPFKGERRWRWQFIDTPYPDPDGGPPVWIACEGETVVGQIALQPAALFIDGAELPAGWIVDVMVRPQHRGLGLAHRIHAAMVASGRTLVTLTMAPATRRVADRAGAITLPPVHTLLRPRRLSGPSRARVLHEPIERRAGLVRMAGRAFVASKIGPATIAGAANLARRLGEGRPPRGDGVEVALGGAPEPGAADALFARCAAGYPALFDRRAAFLDWRFGQAPDLDYRWAQARRNGELSGLAVWRLPLASELPFGVLSDAWAPPQDLESHHALVSAAVAAMEDDTEAVIAGASHPAQLAVLKRHGFRIVRTHRPTIVTADDALRASLARTRSWRFGKADHDWDQVTPAP